MPSRRTACGTRSWPTWARSKNSVALNGRVLLGPSGAPARTHGLLDKLLSDMDTAAGYGKQVRFAFLLGSRDRRQRSLRHVLDRTSQCPEQILDGHASAVVGANKARRYSPVRTDHKCRWYRKQPGVVRTKGGIACPGAGAPRPVPCCLNLQLGGRRRAEAPEGNEPLRRSAPSAHSATRPHRALA